ncbi:MAG: N-formylglutamate deformylase [Sandaracinaceae bacterium]
MHDFHLAQGDRPILASMPHVGTEVPKFLLPRLTRAARAVPDTDWLLPELYDFLEHLGVSRLAAVHARQWVDLNRPPDDAPLYDGPTTGLVPHTLFDGRSAWQRGAAPDPSEVAIWLESGWRPYHRALGDELARLRRAHGEVVLLDLHSIRSRVPRLFEGRLPDVNLGTNDGASCDRSLTEALVRSVAGRGYDHVVDGRFRGGYITRFYGRPGDGVHAVQLELVQATYMDEDAPPAVSPERARRVRPVLRAFVEAALRWIEERTGSRGR